MMIYDAQFVDESLYKTDVFEGVEDDGTMFKLSWASIHDFETGKRKLVPDGLLELFYAKKGWR
ncbi:hypothetical protein SH601_14305 [Gracilibacillus sp. S3-1-1]|uniref:Uncharacterized protein n=1 Tax=Gracilibacillus pellucidus TaxID=3095368 RepID=A0ACC6M867_9BACI|nr:hypothetical protein [Gracilibacillus sp. S3-1-1]MDX8047160.1 hypothetical protein [Gracilibacillus sp. S3-1-1]